MSGNGFFSSEMGESGLWLSKKWVGVCRFCRKIGGSGLLFLKNAWEGVVFLEKWVVVFVKNVWEWVRAAGGW